MAYPKTEPKADFPALERETLEFWRNDDTFHSFRSMTGHRLEMVCRTGGIWAYPR